MNSKISLLGLTALLGVSALAHASWNKYTAGHGQGDCREMRCQYGCIEDDAYNGKCCPAGQYGDKCWGGQCCQSDFVCSSDSGEGTCGCPETKPIWDSKQKKCVECIESGDCKNGLTCNTKTNTCGCEKDEDCEGELVCLPEKICGCSDGTTGYTKTDGTTGCCNDNTITGTHVLADITGDTAHKVCCPKEIPVWDSTQQKCVECVTNEDCKNGLTCNTETNTCVQGECIELFTRSETNRNGMGDSKGCCPDGTRLTTTTNTPNAPRGYIVGGGKIQYGCCPKERAMDNKCCVQNYLPYKRNEQDTVQCCKVLNGANLLVDKGDGYYACCSKNTPYFVPQVNKCVQCTEDADCQNVGDGFICRLDNYTCVCPVGQVAYNRNGSRGCCVNDGDGNCCPEDRIYKNGQTGCCPVGYFWDDSENACVVEAELSVDTKLQYRQYNMTLLKFVNATSAESYADNCSRLGLCYSPQKCATATETVTLTLTVPDDIDFEDGSYWQIVGSDPKAKINGHIQQADCAEFTGEFTLTDNWISSNGLSDFTELKKNNEKCPGCSACIGGNGAGQHLHMEQKVSQENKKNKNKNVITVSLRVNGLYGASCTKYAKGRGVDGEVYQGTIKLKLM